MKSGRPTQKKHPRYPKSKTHPQISSRTTWDKRGRSFESTRLTYSRLLHRDHQEKGGQPAAPFRRKLFAGAINCGLYKRHSGNHPQRSHVLRHSQQISSDVHVVSANQLRNPAPGEPQTSQKGTPQGGTSLTKVHTASFPTNGTTVTKQKNKKTIRKLGQQKNHQPARNGAPPLNHLNNAQPNLAPTQGKEPEAKHLTKESKNIKTKKETIHNPGRPKTLTRPR